MTLACRRVTAPAEGPVSEWKVAPKANAVEALPKVDSWLASDFQVISRQFGSFKRTE